MQRVQHTRVTLNFEHSKAKSWFTASTSKMQIGSEMNIFEKQKQKQQICWFVFPFQFLFSPLKYSRTFSENSGSEASFHAWYCHCVCACLWLTSSWVGPRVSMFLMDRGASLISTSAATMLLGLAWKGESDKMPYTDKLLPFYNYFEVNVKKTKHWSKKPFWHLSLQSHEQQASSATIQANSDKQY